MIDVVNQTAKVSKPAALNPQKASANLNQTDTQTGMSFKEILASTTKQEEKIQTEEAPVFNFTADQKSNEETQIQGEILQMLLSQTLAMQNAAPQFSQVQSETNLTQENIIQEQALQPKLILDSQTTQINQNEQVSQNQQNGNNAKNQEGSIKFDLPLESKTQKTFDSSPVIGFKNEGEIAINPKNEQALQVENEVKSSQPNANQTSKLEKPVQPEISYEKANTKTKGFKDEEIQAQMGITQEKEIATPRQEIVIKVSDQSTMLDKTPVKQVSNNIIANLKQGKSEFLMQLTPEGLGKVAVKLIAQKGLITIELLAENPTTQSLLLANSGEIKDFVFAKTQTQTQIITPNQNLQQDYTQQQKQQQNHQQPQNEQQQRQQHNISGVDFIELLNQINTKNNTLQIT